MINRKKEGSIVCPSCGRLVSVNAPKCIHCGRKNPGLWGYGPLLNKILGDSASLVQPIILFASVLYVISLLLDPSAAFRSFGFLTLLSPSTKALFRLGMTGALPMKYGLWWTVVTAIYLHGGLLHILFNMLWLKSLGQPTEQFYGVSRTFLIFTISGVVGFLVSNMFGIQITIGASGSIFGLLGALVYYGRSRGGTLGRAIYQQVGTWAVVMFLMGFMMPGINNLAHGGGFVGGYAAAFLLGYQDQKPETQGHKIAAIGLAVFTLFCFVLAITAK